MANRYWVGGNGTWDGTAGTKWSTTSGGAGGAAVPTSADDVFLNAASGTVTVTISGSRACNNFNCTGFTGTLTGSTITAGTLNVTGDYTLSTGMSVTYGGIGTRLATVFNRTTTTQNITCAGKSIFTVTKTGAGTAVQQDALNTSSQNFTVNAGTWNSNGNTVTCNAFSIPSGNLTLGASSFTCSTFSCTSTGTVTAGTSSISVTSVSSHTFAGNGQTYYNVIFSNISNLNIITITGTNTFNNLTYVTGSSTFTSRLQLSANQTINGTLTLTGNFSGSRIFVSSDTYLTPRTITAAAVSLSNCDFQSITAAGAASPFTGTTLGNALDNTNITFTAAVNRYSVADGNWSSTAVWSDSNGGSSGFSVPLPQDTAYIYNNLTTNVLNFAKNIYVVSGQLTGSSGTLGQNIYGDFESSVAFNSPSQKTITFFGAGSQTIQYISNLQAVNINSNGGTYTAVGNCTFGGFTLTRGTFNANTYNISNANGGDVVISGSNIRSILLGSGTWTVTGATWNAGTTTNLTFTKGTANIVMARSGTKTDSFIGGGLTYNNITFSGTGTGTVTITGSNTFDTFASTMTAAYTLNFTSGTTNTANTWNLNGLSTATLTLKATTTSAATLAKAGGGTATINYATISYITGTPINTWYATNSTNGGNNTNITFFTNSNTFLMLF